MSRNTKQKEILIEYLKANPNKHVSIKQIKENVGEGAGLTTIYRLVNSLVISGEIIKIPLDNKQGFCYQYNENIKKCSCHYHLICEKCGKLEHFECTFLENVIDNAKDAKDFLIDKNKVVFYGKCGKCRE